MDDTFYGVHVVDEFVVVPLAPDTPFMVGIAEKPPAGTLFDVRAPFLRGVPLLPELYKYVALGIEPASEGSIRVVPEGEVAAVGTLELRYCVGVSALDKDALVQLGLRMSMATNDLGLEAQRAFGGVLIKGDAAAQS